MTIRDDVAAAAGGITLYYDRDNRFPNVASLRISASGDQFCTATLIDSRTLLTAAHCFGDPPELADRLGPRSEASFDPAAGPGGVALSSVVVHERYDAIIPTGDLALVALSRPVTDLVPSLLADDLPATGQQIYMVGFGTTVLASLGYDPADDDVHPDLVLDARRRVAHNILDYVGEAALMAATYKGVGIVLGSDIDIPQSELERLSDEDDVTIADFNSLGSAVALPLEGGVEPGDSGGPLFIVGPDGRLIQVGVATAINDPDHALSLVQEDPLALGYGGQNVWIAIAPFLDWIWANGFLRTSEARPGDGLWSAADHWSGGVVPSNSDGYVDGGGARYYNVRLARPGTTTLDMNATVDSLTLAHNEAALDVPTGRRLHTEVHTALNAGRLDLSGELVAPRLYLRGGTLAGSGRITTTEGLRQSGGTIAPGGINRIGTLTVDGPVTQTGGLLLIELTPESADLLAVEGGAATLAGKLQTVLLETTPPAEGTVYRVVTADSLDTSEIGGPDDIGAVTFDLIPEPDGLQLTVGRRSLGDFADEASRPVADILDRLRGREDFAAIFDRIDILAPSEIGKALDEVGGASTTSATTAKLSSAQFLGASSQRIASRRNGRTLGDQNALALQSLMSPEPGAAAVIASEASMEQFARPRFFGPTDGLGTQPAEAPAFTLGANSGELGLGGDLPWGLWAQPYGLWAERRGEGSGDRYDTFVGGVAGGFDYQVSGGADQGLLVGLSFGYAAAETNHVDLDDQTRSRSYQLGLYAGWWQGPWALDAGAGLALNRYESRRDLTLASSEGPALADYDGREYFGHLEGSYRHEFPLEEGRLELTPTTGFQAMHLETDGYTETGAGVLNLAVGSDSVTSLRSNLGASLAYATTLAGGTELRPEVRARWSHEFGDRSTSLDAAFAGTPGTGFEVRSEDIGRDALLLGLGIEARLDSAVSISAAYDVQLQDGFTAQAVTGLLTFRF